MTRRSSKPAALTLTLTDDEALALLEICIHSKFEDDPLKEHVMQKVADLCRDFIKAGCLDTHSLPIVVDRNVRETLEQLFRVKPSTETLCV
jgi:hypothetical protein